MSTLSATATPPAPAAKRDRFPSGIPYIIGNEGAERFSFYGMRQILYIYLAALFGQMLAQGMGPADATPEVRATQVTHLFMAAVYASPMIGAILADRVLGKYRVILTVSLLYCVGNALMAFAAYRGMTGELRVAEIGAYAGLALIALSSGGIKPCVSANVGDQFTADNSHLVTKIFQIFYFIINFGSFFATLLTPWLFRNYGPAVAFGVPGILMLIATAVFWAGRNRFVKVPPKPGGKLGMLDFVSSVLFFAPIGALMVGFFASDAGHGTGDAAGAGGLAGFFATFWPHLTVAVVAPALGLLLYGYRQRLQEDAGFLSVLLYTFAHRRERKIGEGFFAPAARHFGEEAAEGPPAVLRIIVVFSMISVFWALFDQHSSTWVEQARQMNLRLEVPYWFFSWFLVPAIVALALYGLFWLLSWVSNRPLGRRSTLAVFTIVALWGVGAVVAGFVSPRTQTLTLLAAQIAGLNPLMVMIIIPGLNLLVYGPLERRGRPLKPLRRMTIGMFLASLAFVGVALLQMRIETLGRGEVPVLWQVIPYVLITAGEVLVSVTGLEFAYTQAPRAMKSTIMGFWYLCVTFGNILVAFLAPLQTLSMSNFFWVFAVLMAGAAVLFALLAHTYKGKTYLQHAG